jgi:hypothetical protein
MTTLREAAQQALEALELVRDADTAGASIGLVMQARATYEPTIAALRAALEQPEQEPVAWPEGYEPHELPADYTGKLWIEGQVRRLYEAPPPRREWRGLKEWEINDGLDQLPTEDVCSWSFRKGVYFAEAALKQRNV